GLVGTQQDRAWPVLGKLPVASMVVAPDHAAYIGLLLTPKNRAAEAGVEIDPAGPARVADERNGGFPRERGADALEFADGVKRSPEPMPADAVDEDIVRRNLDIGSSVQVGDRGGPQVRILESEGEPRACAGAHGAEPDILADREVRHDMGFFITGGGRRVI